MKKRNRSFGKCEKCGYFNADLRIKIMNSRKYNYYCWGCFQTMVNPEPIINKEINLSKSK